MLQEQINENKIDIGQAISPEELMELFELKGYGKLDEEEINAISNYSNNDAVSKLLSSLSNDSPNNDCHQLIEDYVDQCIERRHKDVSKFTEIEVKYENIRKTLKQSLKQKKILSHISNPDKNSPKGKIIEIKLNDLCYQVKNLSRVAKCAIKDEGYVCFQKDTWRQMVELYNTSVDHILLAYKLGNVKKEELQEFGATKIEFDATLKYGQPYKKKQVASNTEVDDVESKETKSNKINHLVHEIATIIYNDNPNNPLSQTQIQTIESYPLTKLQNIKTDLENRTIIMKELELTGKGSIPSRSRKELINNLVNHDKFKKAGFTDQQIRVIENFSDDDLKLSNYTLKNNVQVLSNFIKKKIKTTILEKLNITDKPTLEAMEEYASYEELVKVYHSSDKDSQLKQLADNCLAKKIIKIINNHKNNKGYSYQLYPSQVNVIEQMKTNTLLDILKQLNKGVLESGIQLGSLLIAPPFNFPMPTMDELMEKCHKKLALNKKKSLNNKEKEKLKKSLYKVQTNEINKFNYLFLDDYLQNNNISLLLKYLKQQTGYDNSNATVNESKLSINENELKKQKNKPQVAMNSINDCNKIIKQILLTIRSSKPWFTFTDHQNKTLQNKLKEVKRTRDNPTGVGLLMKSLKKHENASMKELIFKLSLLPIPAEQEMYTLLQKSQGMNLTKLNFIQKNKNLIKVSYCRKLVELYYDACQNLSLDSKIDLLVKEIINNMEIPKMVAAMEKIINEHNPLDQLSPSQIKSLNLQTKDDVKKILLHVLKWANSSKKNLSLSDLNSPLVQKIGYKNKQELFKRMLSDHYVLYDNDLRKDIGDLGQSDIDIGKLRCMNYLLIKGDYEHFNKLLNQAKSGKQQSNLNHNINNSNENSVTYGDMHKKIKESGWFTDDQCDLIRNKTTKDERNMISQLVESNKYQQLLNYLEVIQSRQPNNTFVDKPINEEKKASNLTDNNNKQNDMLSQSIVKTWLINHKNTAKDLEEIKKLLQTIIKENIDQTLQYPHGIVKNEEQQSYRDSRIKAQVDAYLLQLAYFDSDQLVKVKKELQENIKDFEDDTKKISIMIDNFYYQCHWNINSLATKQKSCCDLMTKIGYLALEAENTSGELLGVLYINQILELTEAKLIEMYYSLKEIKSDKKVVSLQDIKDVLEKVQKSKKDSLLNYLKNLINNVEIKSQRDGDESNKAYWCKKINSLTEEQLVTMVEQIKPQQKGSLNLESIKIVFYQVKQSRKLYLLKKLSSLLDKINDKSKAFSIARCSTKMISLTEEQLAKVWHNLNKKKSFNLEEINKVIDKVLGSELEINVGFDATLNNIFKCIHDAQQEEKQMLGKKYMIQLNSLDELQTLDVANSLAEYKQNPTIANIRDAIKAEAEDELKYTDNNEANNTIKEELIDKLIFIYQILISLQLIYLNKAGEQQHKYQLVKYFAQSKSIFSSCRVIKNKINDYLKIEANKNNTANDITSLKGIQDDLSKLNSTEDLVDYLGLSESRHSFFARKTGNKAIDSLKNYLKDNNKIKENIDTNDEDILKEYSKEYSEINIKNLIIV